MQSKTVAIRTQTLDGGWETTGVDRLRGVWPENDSYTADEWGSSRCSFDLHRDPGAIFPDLSAFTPIDVEVGGQLVWSGRVKETPTREAERVLNVQGEGWQFHLDDDTFQRTYIATRLSDFKDSRSIPRIDLNLYRAAGNVSNDRGLVIGWGHGENIQNVVRVGATFDAGPGNLIEQVIYELSWTNRHSTAFEFWIVGTVASPTPLGTDSVNALQLNLAGGSSETDLAIAGLTLSSPCRFIHVFLKNIGGDSAATAGEVNARLRSIMLVASSAYQSSNASRLSADMIVADALDRGTILLSADQSAIDTTSTFFFPEFALDGQKSAREVWQAANAAMAWRSKIDVYRRAIFAPRPSTPEIEIGAWPGSEFDDASANDGSEIYNRVIVEGTGPDGEKLSVQRTQGQQAGVALSVISSPAADNPSFVTNTTSWTPSTGTTITRDAGVFDTSPASGAWARTGGLLAGDTLIETFTGTFLKGVTYALTMRVRGSAGGPVVRASLGVAGDSAEQTVWSFGLVAFTTRTVSWTPSSDRTGVTLKLTVTNVFAAVTTFYVDSLSLSAAQPTLVDRRGFKRTHVLPVKASLTDALGQQIADVWLAAHRTTPLKGALTVTGDRAVRGIQNGASIPPERLLTMTGDLLRLSHRIDPDTGGQGRDGRIAEVTYKPADDTAVVAIDSRRTSHEALLERLAVVVGSA